MSSLSGSCVGDPQAWTRLPAGRGGEKNKRASEAGGLWCLHELGCLQDPQPCPSEVSLSQCMDWCGGQPGLPSSRPRTASGRSALCPEGEGGTVGFSSAWGALFLKDVNSLFIGVRMFSQHLFISSGVL